MPRFKIGYETPPRRSSSTLVARLADELRSDRKAGQPFIYEQTYSTGRIRALVVWDEWKELTHEDRTATILAAFEQAEGKDYRERIALASGLTIPEAYTAGMLPYHVFPALRKGDLVSVEECRAALLAEGATSLMGANLVQLRVATEEEAEACRRRLADRLPKSEDVWVITKELTAEEFAGDDSAGDDAA